MTEPITVDGSHPWLRISTPLTLIGIFVAVLRERFDPATFSDPVLPWAWKEDLKETEIFIESGFNEEIEARNARPAIWVDRAQNNYGRVSVGDQDQMPIDVKYRHETFYSTAETDMLLQGSAPKRGESMLVGSITQDFLHMTSRYIEAVFGLRDMSPVIMGRTVPYEKDKNLWNTPVELRTFYEIRWAGVPMATLLTRLYMKIADKDDPESFFRDFILKA